MAHVEMRCASEASPFDGQLAAFKAELDALDADLEAMAALIVRLESRGAR